MLYGPRTERNQDQRCLALAHCFWTEFAASSELSAQDRELICRVVACLGQESGSLDHPEGWCMYARMLSALVSAVRPTITAGAPVKSLEAGAAAAAAPAATAVVSAGAARTATTVSCASTLTSSSASSVRSSLCSALHASLPLTSQAIDCLFGHVSTSPKSPSLQDGLVPFCVRCFAWPSCTHHLALASSLCCDCMRCKSLQRCVATSAQKS